MDQIVEILTYRLTPGSGAAFFAIMQEVSVPLHLKHGIDVVWHGRSLHDADGYGLIRAFETMEALEAQQAAFYAGDDWRTGPREEIVSRIAGATKIVVPMNAAAIAGLRAQRCFSGSMGEV
ncbi:NIPSNAP family containing protein [Rhizobium rhizosphaerae]|uniref:NIPSNAP family containing protein n=1 Tax=Xaviernesmea rhizosphaerae TaxID=1672749 RepID=A0A1Q9AQD4_9HYPH|nr:NIPSNAP family protein [Xaviernesmea rhizosphaerae]OLP57633.1 NIPSNAP family containing protein [Xaviernesmea rhizosphaerae]